MNSKMLPSTSAQARKELEAEKLRSATNMNLTNRNALQIMNNETNPGTKLLAAEDLNCIQLNMNKSQDCQRTLDELFNEETIDFCFLQETPKTGMTLTGAEPIKANGESRAQIWIRKSVAANMNYIKLAQFIDKDHAAVQVTITLDGQIRTLILASVYCENNGTNPEPVSSKMKEIRNFATENKYILLICADANAHNVAYGSKRTNARGRILVDWIESSDMCLLNHGDAPTWKRSNGSSVIDITFCLNEMVKFMHSWMVLSKDSNSDHMFIAFQIAYKSPRKIFKRNVRDTNWPKYDKSCKAWSRTFKPDPTTPDEINSSVTELVCKILQSFEENCKNKELKPRTSSHFDDDLRRKRNKVNKIKEKTRKIVKGSIPNKEFKEKWNKAREASRAYNKENKRKKLLSQRKKISEVNDMPKAARMMRILEGKRLTVARTTVRVGELFTKNISETAKAFLKRHFIDAEPCGDPMKLEEEHTAPDYDLETLTKIDEIFTDASVLDSIHSLNPYKAPGLDGIFPIMLQKIAKYIAPTLKKIFRACIKLNYMPKFWRTQNVIFIPKPGKPNYDDPKAYRPICLASFIFKVMEKILDRYIRNTLGDKIFNEQQHAYRKNRSTETCLLEFTKMVGKSYRGDNRCLVICIDYSQAFDSATHEALLQAAAKKEIGHWLTNYIENIMHNRAVKADFDIPDNETGEENFFFPPHGTAQGMTLSPLIWNLLMDDLMDRLKEAKLHNFSYFVYADDVSLVFTGKKSELADMTRRANKIMRIINEWSISKGLKINAEKTVHILFSNGNKGKDEYADKLNDIMLGDTKIARVEQVKYLGVIFDRKLKFDAQVEDAINRGRSGLFAARRVIGKDYGLNPWLTNWIFNCIVTPRITYGAIIWYQAAKKGKWATELRKLQRLACLLTLGCTRSSPTDPMLALLNMDELYIKIEESALKTCLRMKSTNCWTTNGVHFLKDTEKTLTDITNNEKSDRMEVQYVGPSKFECIVRDTQNWFHDLDLQNSIKYFSDGSVKEDKCGIGVASTDSIPEIKVAARISDDSFPSLTECHALSLAIVSATRRRYVGKKILFLTDSKTVVNQVRSLYVRSKAVMDCIDGLRKITDRGNNVKVVWCPKSSNYGLSKVAHDLSREGTLRQAIDITTATKDEKLNAKISKWARNKTIENWNEKRGKMIASGKWRVAAESFSPYNKEITQQLLRMSRKDLRVVSCLLLGHAPTNHLLNIIKEKEGEYHDPFCRFCRDEREKPEHILLDCWELNEKRKKVFGKEKLTLKDIHEIPKLHKIAEFARITKADEIMKVCSMEITVKKKASPKPLLPTSFFPIFSSDESDEDTVPTVQVSGPRLVQKEIRSYFMSTRTS